MAGLVSGLISWFGGPNDKTTGSTTASGAPTSTPGIAVDNRQTLGGWWLLKLPNGVVSLVRQTDIGPAPSTGRTFDFTYSLLHFLGYSQQTFPTNAQASGVYLGKASTSADLVASQGAAINNALNTLGATPQQVASFMAQADVGSTGLRNASVLALQPNGQPSADTSTGIGSSAVPSNIIPSPSIGTPGWAAALGSVLNWLITPSSWLRVLKFVGGGVLVFMALKALTGVETPNLPAVIPV